MYILNINHNKSIQQAFIMSGELKQINIFDTIFQFAEQYDPDIKNIKVYGILDENNHCSDPYFMFNDVINYIKGSIDNNSTRRSRGFKNPREIIQMNVSQNKRDAPNLLTRYGMIRAVGLCKKDTKASVAFREFIYCLFDALDAGHTYRDPVYSAFRTSMESTDIQNELKHIDNEKTGGIVYFIKNLTTNNIKIGRTHDDIEKRLSNLQIGNDCELAVVKTIECDSRVVEAKLHEKFAEFHIRGEWYNITEEQI